MAENELTIETSKRGDGYLLRLRGDLDLATAPRLDDAIVDVIFTDPRELVLDLSTLSFMDSTGLNCILKARTRLEADDCELALIPGPDLVQRMFALSGTEDSLTFVDR